MPELDIMVMSSEGHEHTEIEPGAGGVSKVIELDVWIKYCPGMETTLPYYTYTEFKAHRSRIWLDRNTFLTSKCGAHIIAWNNDKLSRASNCEVGAHTTAWNTRKATDMCG